MTGKVEVTEAQLPTMDGLDALAAVNAPTCDKQFSAKGRIVSPLVCSENAGHDGQHQALRGGIVHRWIENQCDASKSVASSPEPDQGQTT